MARLCGSGLEAVARTTFFAWAPCARGVSSVPTLRRKVPQSPKSQPPSPFGDARSGPFRKRTWKGPNPLALCENSFFFGISRVWRPRSGGRLADRTDGWRGRDVGANSRGEALQLLP